ncbi:exosortase E/protease, VPEID-CTERM system [Silvibacterium dinghuense]|uniref:exosortase E/protease, VPEID-CTERM system n=1 Tax=Silvibacterium dinghuense TaxID=1560006 RepID=UPI0013E98A35|nr:exosortase E/protease, VPEID-CTERM system [Silvibacterium dinghuense]
MASLLAADCLLLASVPRRAPIFGVIAPFAIVAFAVFAGLGRRRLKLLREPLPFRRAWFFWHLAGILSIYLMYWIAPRGPKYRPYALPAHVVATIVVSCSMVLLLFACIPLRASIRALRETSPLWFVSIVAGLAAALIRRPTQQLWDTSALAHGRILQITAFHCVHLLLHALLPGVIVNPATFVIGTPRFAVTIAEQCSGIEGLGLVLIFTCIWLWYLRRETRFPQALLLIPLALVAVWLLNIVRIAVIILIGNAGAPSIAMVGFHSQAGWIAFTLVSLAFSMATSRIAWFQKSPVAAAAPAAPVSMLSGSLSTQNEIHASRESAATAAYLVPFLAILAASFLSRSASGYFEWLYPLRFLAAIIALWLFRTEYRKLRWSFGWLAPLAGTGIFLLWIAPEFWSHPDVGRLGSDLAALSPSARSTWIAFRAAAAIVTVPIAEELAFRGYLARRLMRREFEQISFSKLTPLAILLSSAIFGILHGSHWLAGILAGLAFAGAARWRGRIGDAVVAHATSNLLLTLWVLLRHDWSQW